MKYLDCFVRKILAKQCLLNIGYVESIFTDGKYLQFTVKFLEK